MRAKRNVLFDRRRSRSVDRSSGLRCDQTVVLSAIESAKLYPDVLRRVSFWDEEKSRRLVLLGNNFLIPALTIPQIYRLRWRVELFFNWIKQHLRIKAFYGTTENAVKIQIWVAIVRKRLGLEASLYEIVQILSVTLFEETPISQAFQRPIPRPISLPAANQFNLFDF